jgi:hypothetical protein
MFLMSAPLKALCPKCNRLLMQAGEITLPDGQTLPVFQCDECLVNRPVFEGGDNFEMALTFALRGPGPIFETVDPAKPDQPLRF